MAEGLTVGKVSLRVMPDLDGFRQRVEAEIRRMGDVEVDVNPDTTGFAQKVKAATSGLRADVDTVLDTKGLRSKAKLAAAAASGETVTMKAKLSDLSLAEQIKMQAKSPAEYLGRQIREAIEEEVRKNPPKIPAPDIEEPVQAQRKVTQYLSKLRTRFRRAQKELASPVSYTKILPLQEFTLNAQELNQQVRSLRKLTDATKAYHKEISGKDYKKSDALKIYEDVSKISARLANISRETGIAHPAGFRQAADGLAQLRKALELPEQRFGEISAAIRDYTQDVNIVQRKSLQELRRNKRMENNVYRETMQTLEKVRDTYRSTSKSISRSLDATADKISRLSQTAGPATRRLADDFKDLGRAVRTNFYEAFDPNQTWIHKLEAPSRRAGNSIRELGGHARGAGHSVRELASGLRQVARETRVTDAVSDTLTSTFKRLRKESTQLNTSGFGGRRRRGLKSIDEVGTERFAGLTRVGWIITAIAAIAAPVVQLISGIVAALPALGGAALAALGVTLLGLEGIKDAAQAAAPALERAQEAVSGIFRERLTSQFEQLGGLLDTLGPQLQNMAHGMADFSQGITDGLTSATGTGNLQKLLDNTAALFSQMQPFSQSFTEGLLNMAGAGSETFPALAEGMNRFGTAFRDNIADLADTGQLQDAIEATYDVLGSLGTNLGRILREGIETAPEMVGGLTTLFDGLGDAIVAILPALSEFSSTVFTGAGNLLSGLATDIENTSSTLSEHAPTLERDFQRIKDALGEISGWDSEKGFFENLFGKPAITEAEAERFAAVIDNVATMLENAPERFAASMEDMKARWADFFSFLDGGEEDGFQVPFHDASVKATDGIKSWWEDFKLLFSEEGRAKIKELSADPELKIGKVFEGEDDGGGFAGIGEKVATFFSGVRESLISGSAGLFTDIVGLFSNIGTAVGEIFSGIGTAISGLWSGITASLSGLASSIGSIFSSIGSTVSGIFSGMVSGLVGAAQSLYSGITGALSGLPGAVSGFFSSAASSMTSIMSGAAASVTGVVSGLVASAVSILSSLPGRAQAALGNVGGLLVASGRALVQGFINGITSMIGAVRSAASSVVAAARNFFPFSPAKEGPFSGRGYTTFSGAALAKDFAKGMLSGRISVRDAAAGITGVAKKQFDQVSADMEAFKRDQVLQPVLEANAKKIADWRKRQAEAEEKSAERIQKIREGDAKQATKEKNIAEERERLAKQNAESYERLLESLEVPDYSTINRSFADYWVGGLQDVINARALELFDTHDATAQARTFALRMRDQIREVLGDHPILHQIEPNVNAEHFEFTLKRTLEESGITEVPINLVVSNLDQLKRDLGMGNGVASRLLEQAVNYDPANTDAVRYERDKPEIHYHVTDMEEAIRLENQRQRKEMMKIHG